MINNKSYLIILFIFTIISSFTFGQSIQELQALQRLLSQSKNLTNSQNDDRSVIDTNNRQVGQTAQTVLTAPEVKYHSKKGKWESTVHYNKWMQESNGDTSAMELFGFIPDTSIMYFGYNIFTQRDSIAFWQNLPAPDIYILGSGDEIQISLWGETQLNNLYTINRDGNIYIERVGLIKLAGVAVNNAKKLIENKFKQNFATLRGKYPSSFIDITINATKSINVHFVGEVNIPGIHLTHPFSSIVTGLIQAGGIKTTGSLRNILVRRNGKTIAELDLYDYILNGNIDYNIQLRENDIIFVPVRKSTIKINGAVYRAGIYESFGQESISQLINYAGGVKYNSSKQITLSRIPTLNGQSRTESVVNQYLFNLEQIKAVFAQDGDQIQIHSIVEHSNEVKILGQVKREGVYTFTKDMTLMDLLMLAGGLEDSLFIKTMYLTDINIVRKNKNSLFNETIKINLNDYLQNDSSTDIKLTNNDVVIVRANSNLQSSNNVVIVGDVNRPGVYALIKNGESLQGIIDRAGGLTERAFKEGIKVIRDTLSVIWDDYSLQLTADDSIFVGVKPGVVAVTGEVYNPGFVTYSKGRSIKSYINSAGGIKPTGNKRDILVVYANGNIKPNRSPFFHPKVSEGANIVVNNKPEREPFSFNQLLRDTASIAASMAMIYYVVTN